MAIKYLGPQVVIHGGGSDLVFPHHTCEIAQSENATDERPFVDIWMHGAMVRLDGEKMSKSLGNLILVRDLLSQYSADAIRVLLLSHHYRDPWEYSVEDMRAAQALADRLAAAAAPPEDALTRDRDIDTALDGDTVVAQARLELEAALEDDFHTERALEALDRLAAHAPRSGSGSLGQARGLRELADLLGLCLTPASASSSTAAAGQPCEA
jgi:cysteinyl-tRNA synthetase